MAKAVEINNLNSRSLYLKGLDCPDCAAKIEKAVSMIPGVANATVVFPLGKLNIAYDEAQTGVKEVIERVQALGYDAQLDGEADEQYRSTTLRIEGMDCADCAAKLEKHIAHLPGVKEVTVNFGAAKLTVTHQGPVTAIVDAIQMMGYKGAVDHTSLTLPGPYWKRNQYVVPTAISLLMLALGLLAVATGLADPISKAFFIAGIVLGGFLPAKNGLAVLINARQLDMNILMSIAVVGAAAIGEFVEAAAVVFLFSLGNALQGYTLDRTRNSIRALMDLAPQQALVVRDGAELTLPLEDIVIGDVIIVRPGEKIAMDGRVIAGSSTVNQASITGESVPVEKTAGDEVYAGTINERGSLQIEVTRLAKDNTISRIIAMVEEAQGQRAPSQQFVDRFAKYYTPLVISGAALVVAVPTLLMGQPFHKWFYQAMAMLLVACPCALVISTPVSIVAAIGSAARNGVLVKGGLYLEEAGALSVIAFDKTGTLTAGKPQVTDVIPVNGYSEDQVLSISAAIESRSEHPLGEAILSYARQKGLDIPAVSGFEAVWGMGAVGRVDGVSYQIGNVRFFRDHNIDIGLVEDRIRALQNQGKTVMILGKEGLILGLIAVADVLRDNSSQAIQKLRKLGIKKIVMLTGDNETTARAIAAQVGVDEYRADLLPGDKVDAVKELLSRCGKAAMVGDGVNDAPALAISTVGIAMGVAGSDTALETADIALMADDLTKLPYSIRLSRQTLKIIKQNIAFALVIKGLILLLVFPGWLTLWLAVAADMGSSLLVTLNGMRLLRVRHAD
ncbi:MAG: cadmium-translocating P-type ATPase [Syntrophomonadaceae bacterium]|jgi:Cd2+/Zn2+-exporting ATPase|nr:cadmium-translocating P-type ATPase [Syntrophomonadaceae bacterium]